MRPLFILIAFFSSLFSQAQTLEEVNALIATKEYEKAEGALLVKSDLRSSLEFYDKLGQVYALQLKWDEAIGVYKDLVLLAPEQASYHYSYGGVLAKKAQNSNKLVAFSLLGRIKKAFKKAIALDSQHINAYWALVDLYVSLPGIVGGSYASAFKYAGDLKRISKVDGYFAMGYIHEYKREPKAAKMNYFEALRITKELTTPLSNQLRYQIGKVCGDYGVDLELGIKHLSDYIESYTAADGVPIEWAYYRMAKLHRKNLDKRQATQWIDKALQKRPKFDKALNEAERIRAIQ